MEEYYTEFDNINENDDEETLFFNHVVQQDETLIALDELLKKSYSTI